MHEIAVHSALVARRPQTPDYLLSPFSRRLQEARRRVFPTSSAAAKAWDWPLSSYQQHENSTRVPERETVEKYASAFRVPLGWLLTGEGRPDKVKVVGMVGAAQTIIPFGPDELEWVAQPGAADGAVEAVQVRGDSMYPVYKNNDLIFYEKRDFDQSALMGRECVVQLSDGRSLIKIIRAGVERGRFNLESFNAPTIENVEITWAVPVRWVEKR